MVREMFVPLSHPPGPRAVRLRSGVGVHRGQEAQGPLLRDVAASQRRHIHKGISRGDHGGVLRRARVGVPLPGRSAAEHPVTTTRRLPSPRYWEEDVASARVRSRSFSRTTCSATGSAELARATTRAVSEGMVWIRQEELPGADPESGELRCAQRAPGE